MGLKKYSERSKLANKTPLYESHKALNAMMTEFAGWEMPVYYSSIKEEHASVRNSAGLFDIGHMGAIKIAGEAALPFVQKLLSNDASRLTNGGSQYSILLNENGGVIDNVFVYKMNDFYMLVVNAVNTEKDIAWIKKNRIKGIEIWDLKDKMTVLALQGPKAQEILQKISELDLSLVGHHKTMPGKICNIDCLISRTGYTGEDGFEIFVEKRKAVSLWNAILEAGKDARVIPCGLGARDTLRLEAGFPLYGHEYDEEISPFNTGFSFAIKLEKEEDFIGKKALLKQKETGVHKRLVGIKMKNKMIPRQGYSIFVKDNAVGKITSGTFSPSLEYPIAMGYMNIESSFLGQLVEVEIRGKKHTGVVTKLPFYKKTSI